MKTRPIALAAILLSSLASALSAEEVTKATLPTICPKLEIKTRMVNANCRGIQIIVPSDEARFKRLFQAWFIITNEKGELALRLPIQINEIDGVKQIHVDASPELLKNASIELNCKFAEPTRNSLDTVTLILPSLVAPDK